MRILMLPQLTVFRSDESGIKRVVEAYHRYAKEFDIEYVAGDAPHDLVAAHAGTDTNADVAICHGLYWTADYEAGKWEWGTNVEVIKTLRHALEITVPSNWVAETLRRDMRVNPHILPHGIEWDEWQGKSDKIPIILWNKNRSGDVCNPASVVFLAQKYPKLKFVTTFMPPNMENRQFDNIRVVGVIPHNDMKQLIKSCYIYLSTTKETFGIGVLEAMAAGVPVLGFAYGGNLDLIQHGINGYLAQPNNYEDLATGLEYCVAYKEQLGANGREMAKQWTWRNACAKLRTIYELALEKKEAFRTTLPKEAYTV